MSLDDEVATHRRTIRSDGLSMSIGEVVNMYHDEEIFIRPEYQRLFRWHIQQKSRLIESILLGIPLPSIFVAQQEEGPWEVVDGLQRLSTILEFMGELRDEKTKEIIAPKPLIATRYLPALEGTTWTEGANQISQSLRIQLKRARLDFRILLPESDNDTKFELFDRLNSGGAPTSAQEVRSAQLLMIAPDFYRWLDALRSTERFTDCVPLTIKQESEQFDIELALRFIVLANTPPPSLRGYADFESLINERAISLATDSTFNLEAQQQRFYRVFSVLSSVGPEVFRKYDSRRKKPIGPFSVAAYEAVTLGVDENIASWEALPEEDTEAALRQKIEQLWLDSQFQNSTGAGVRPTQRVPYMKSIGERVFYTPAA